MIHKLLIVRALELQEEYVQLASSCADWKVRR